MIDLNKIYIANIQKSSKCMLYLNVCTQYIPLFLENRTDQDVLGTLYDTIFIYINIALKNVFILNYVIP